MTTTYTAMTSKAFHKLGAKPRRSSMTWWSKDDAVMLPRGNSDHWSKMRVKANNFVISRDENGDIEYTKRDPETIANSAGLDFPGNIPGSYHMSLPKNPSARVSTGVNKRAKDGFEFWYKERPKPTSFGKYGIGSYKTVMGLGNAPRT